jgi:hypothetical protein
VLRSRGICLSLSIPERIEIISCHSKCVLSKNGPEDARYRRCLEGSPSNTRTESFAQTSV